MSTYFDEDSNTYRNFENEVVHWLKTIAGEADEAPAEESGSTTEPEVEEIGYDSNEPDPEIASD